MWAKSLLLQGTLCFFVNALSVHGSAELIVYNTKDQTGIALPPKDTFFGNQRKRFVHGSATSPPIPSDKQNLASQPSSSVPRFIYGPKVSPHHPAFPPSGHPVSPAPTAAPRRSSQHEECASPSCTEPKTYPPPGSPCGCVLPIQVKLQLRVALYTFFPLVSNLEEDIAAQLLLNPSQVRVVGGASTASHQVERTNVLINLIPLQETFDQSTAYLIYRKFWNKQVSIKPSLLGVYEVSHVRYPGLPPSPPSAPLTSTSSDDRPLYPNHGNDGSMIKPLGVDLSRRTKHNHGGSSTATLAVVSSFIAFIICVGIASFLLLKCRTGVHPPEEITHVLTSSIFNPSESKFCGSMKSSVSMSFGSSVLAYTGSAKIISSSDIESATNNFSSSRKLGEGGFGLVYRGILDDGIRVAVKVLKRDDQQGDREFWAEVEMLSRLHHRNLVKLIGICIEDHARCLVYELVSNGSVESHLHGVCKETDPLGWGTRMKIALGAARGLAYLHEDSSPCVIHRDFKSSNVLLEHDFTPKISDFGLARVALDEGNKHLSTQVMGTFGYLAPEYAMTGHLLVKSDVYSYGVVLLELLTGRKPVDFSQPPGQENLVASVRPFLTSREGLDTIIDPALKSNNLLFNSMTKVAAIASMCVQPEVSHRPFMGEVVQALKLVCNELNEINEFQARTHNDIKRMQVKSDLANSPVEIEGQDYGSLRRYSISWPIGTGRRELWQRLKELSGGSLSEHRLPPELVGTIVLTEVPF